MVAIRALQPADHTVYRAVRLRGLAEHPEAFSSSHEEETSAEGEARMARRLAPTPSAPHDFMLGAFADGALVGTIGLMVDMRLKTRHSGLVIGMYVVPERSREGVGRALLDALIERARTIPLTNLHLTVTKGNAAACRLYERAGFAITGSQPEAILVAGRLHDKLLMFRRL